MSMNTQQAAAEIRQALEETSGLTVSEDGVAWIDDWCYGEGKGGEPRPDIFSSDDQDLEVNGLCARIALRGNAIVALCESEGVKQITSAVLVEIEKEMSASGTRLCDPLLVAAASTAS